jgi:hypothetical protein
VSDERRNGGGLSDELRPYVDSPEADAIDRIGERLATARPVPRPAFRSELHAHLGDLSERRPRRPRRLKLAAAAYIGSGLLLLAIPASGVAGAGPFAA